MERLIAKALSLSIGTKLTLTFIALIAMTSIPLSFVVIQFSEKVFYENVVKSLRDTIVSEELQIRYYIINRDYWSLFKLVRGLADKTAVREAVVVDGNGKVLAHSDPQRYPIGSSYGGKVDIDYPIKGFRTSIGSVKLVLDEESIWAEFAPVKLFLMFSALPFTLISLVLGLFISYRIRSRLFRITASIEQIRKGDLSNLNRVEFREKDELQEFADFLFSTIKALKNYYENIDYAQKFYMNLLNTINEIVFVTDEEGRIFYANDNVRSIGYKLNDLLGLKIDSLVRYNTKEEKTNKYREVLILGKHREIPALMGEVIYENWRIVTLIDISDRKAMEEELRRREAMSILGEMSANFAHELKNAMLPLKLLSSVDSFSEEDVRVIRNSLMKMDRLVNMFLNFARPVPVEKTKFSLTSIVEDILSLIERKAKEKGIKLIKDVDDVEVVSSRELIEIILVNLLSNAVDAVDGGGEVGVRVRVVENLLKIEVWDTGRGIPKEDLDRIFEPFYTTKDSGSGLGLSIVMKNVYLLKGSIQVNSEEGKGTIFKVSIPIQGVQGGKHTPDRG